MLEATAILVNYRTEEHVIELLECLDGSGGECPKEIIIIDNSPERGLGKRAQVRRSSVRYLPSERNPGFAAAVNRGLESAGEEIIILLNPDARPEPGCLAGLVTLLRDEPSAVVVAPRLVPFHPDASPVPSATRRDPGLWSSLIEYTVVRRFVSPNWLSKHYFVDDSKVAGAVECAMVQGACFAFWKAWGLTLGGFDAERFFLYWEETDFCRRVRQRGGRVLYCPGLTCRHLGGASFGQGGQDVRHFWRSLYAYHRKHHGLLYTALLRALLGGGIAVEYLILQALHLGRGAKDPELVSDLETLRLRLRQQI